MTGANPSTVAVAADTGSLDVSVYGRELLAALVQFMEPVIRRKAMPDSVGIEADGTKLLSALESFITARVQGVTEKHQAGVEGIIEDVVSGGEGATVSHQSDSSTEEISRIANISLSGDNDETGKRKPSGSAITDNEPAPSNELQLVLRRSIPRTELETLTLTAVQRQVYNRMPIRMLSFDSDGKNIRIIERSEIFSRVLPPVQARIASRGFQKKWSKAEKLSDNGYGNFRRDRMNELLDGAIAKVAKYAILSHTWIRTSPGEIIFGKWEQRMKYPAGYSKVVNFCRVAAQNHDMTLGWIDSLCINKESSSELDESIRSMYNWYRRAFVCITFLSETQTLEDDHKDSWYTRGWTLQELLAPRDTCFYSQTWNVLGSTENFDVEEVVTKHTGITAKELDLCRQGDKERIALSRRLQMACGRQVTREEDTSYSLMGLLGIEITIAYGEGSERAFYRLIAQILAVKKDVADLFNRDYLHNMPLIPPSLDSYAHRNSSWDHYEYPGGSGLNYFPATKPIILTHLGVRMPFLLIPSFLEMDTGEPYIPIGDFFGKASLVTTSEDGSSRAVVYNFLDKRLYEDSPDSRLMAHALKLSPTRVHGVFNFGHDSAENILLLNTSAALDLYWRGVDQGQLFYPENVYLLGGNLAFVKLQCKANGGDNDPYVIPRGKLADHGMQLVTLYL